jgi:opacity protein-like surface antigen
VLSGIHKILKEVKMKSSFLMKTLSILFSLQIILFGQTQPKVFNDKSWELNFTGSLGSVESSYDVSASFYSGSNNESQKYFQLGIIPAYYIYRGLAIEPELNIFTVESLKPSYLALGNISYTFAIDSAHYFPFIRAGYGISNSIQIPVNSSIIKYSESLDIGILNLGAGVKFRISESVLLRTEINYRKFSYAKDESSFYKYTSKFTSIALVFGFSVLL